MYPSTDRFTIQHSRMAKHFASYAFGTSVIHKTKGIWLTPVSAAFFRIIAYPNNLYLVEVVTELPFSPILANRPKITIDALDREYDKSKAFQLCKQYFTSLLKYQQNNVLQQATKKNGWLGKFIYSTPPVDIPIAVNFGTDLSWGITQVSKHQFNVYLLAFDDRKNKYEWIEFLSYHRDKTSALDAANEAYQEALAACQYDRALSSLVGN